MNIIVPKGKKVLITMGGVSQVAGVIEAILGTDKRPVITIKGSSFIELNVGDTYTDQGALAVDGNNNTLEVTTTETVDTSNAKIYYVIYEATDSNGATTTAIRSVHVRAVTTKSLFISLNGSDANNGTEASPYRTIQKGVDVATAGTTIYVKAGNYGAEHIVFPRSGTQNAPIRLQGYKTDSSVKAIHPEFATIENKTTDNKNMIMKSSYMPLLDGGGTVDFAFYGTGLGNIEIRGFQVRGYTQEAVKITGSWADRKKHIYIQDIYVQECGWNGISMFAVDYSSINRCYTANVNMHNIAISGFFNEISYNKSFSTRFLVDGTQNTALGGAFMTDYLMACFTSDSSIHHNYIESVAPANIADMNFYGHGLSLVTAKNGNYKTDAEIASLNGDRVKAERNTIYNNHIKGTTNGFEIRFGVDNNVFRDNLLENQMTEGVTFEDGANGNKFYNTTIKGSRYYAISFVETLSNGGEEYGNKFNGNLIDGLTISSPPNPDDYFLFLFYDAIHQAGSEIRNNVFKNVRLVDTEANKIRLFRINSAFADGVSVNNLIEFTEGKELLKPTDGSDPARTNVYDGWEIA